MEKIKALGWIKEYKTKSLVSGDKTVRVTIEFQDVNLDKIKALADHLADVPYLVEISDE